MGTATSPPNVFEDLFIFLRLFASDWIALMSGIGSLVAWIWGCFARTSDPNLAYKFLWPAALVCAFVAFFRLWRKEHTGRIQLLERVFESDSGGPRRLSEEQIARPVTALEKEPGFAVIVRDPSVRDGRRLAMALGHAFLLAKWSAEILEVSFNYNCPVCGLGVRVDDPAMLTSKQTAIVKALQTAGLEFDVQRLEGRIRADIFQAANKDSIQDAEILIWQKEL